MGTFFTDEAACPPNQSDYYGKGAFSVFVQSIPFIGGAIDGYVPSPKTKQDELNQLQANLNTMVSDWQSEITKLTIDNVQDLNNLVSTILGDPDNGVDGYADAVSKFYLEPVREQSIINELNIAFLSILMSIVLMYLLSNKKS